MPVTGTSSREGMEIVYGFQYNGSDAACPEGNWGTRLFSISPISNSSESVDDSYNVSSLLAEFVDTDGSLWGSLGNGTSCLNKAFSLNGTFGGSFTQQYNHPDGTRPHDIGSWATADHYAIHTGKITKVTRKHRLVTVESKSNMRLLGELTWNFPFLNQSQQATTFGSFYFFSGNITTDSGGTEFSKVVADRSNNGLDFSLYAAVATSSQATLNATYAIGAGRGSNTLVVGTGFVYLGTGFRYAFPRTKFSGSYLGTFNGTIDSFSLANEFGFDNVSVADAAKINGSFYPINKTRLSLQNSSLAGSHFIFQQAKLQMAGNPATVFTELLSGAMVYPYFTTSDIDSSSFADFNSIMAFQSSECFLDPGEELVVDYLKNLLETTMTLFAVTPANTFQPIVYGPKNLAASIQTLGSNDIIDSAISNEIEDYHNKVIIHYDWDYTNNKYRKSQWATSSSWTASDDRPMGFESKWIKNDNQIAVTLQRLLQRYGRSLPRIELTLPLSKIDVPLGSLYAVTDADTGLSAKNIQVVGYEKDINDSRQVNIDAIDADNLFKQAGYAFWGTVGTLPGDTGNSGHSAIWGTTINGNWYDPQVGTVYGTAPGINTALYGTRFVFF